MTLSSLPFSGIEKEREGEEVSQQFRALRKMIPNLSFLVADDVPCGAACFT